MSAENTNSKIELFRVESKVKSSQRTIARIHARKPDRAPDLAVCWKMIRRRQWTVLAAFVVMFGTILIVTLAEKPVYRAKTLLEIDKENAGLVSGQELLQLDDVSDAYLETQYKVLGSDDLAQRVIDQLGLSKVPEFQSKASVWPWDELKSSTQGATLENSGVPTSGPAAREAVLANFQKQLLIKPNRRSRTVEMLFDSQDPDLAALVVNTLAASYVQKNLEAHWDATQTTSEWLSRQLQDLKTKLQNSETELQNYTSQNGLLFLATDKGASENVVNQSLRELQDELSKAQAARYEKESLYRVRNSTDLGSLPGADDNKTLQELSVRLADLQRERAQLLSTFTEDYPKVVQASSAIAETQAALDREHQHALQRISTDYFSAVKREALLQNAFKDKQKQVNVVAEKSVQYGILSREVDSNQNLYDGLLQKLKEAGVSAGLRASNIRVVDPAVIPFSPNSPRIPLNLSLAAILGLGLGLCVALVQEHLDQTLKSVHDVEGFLHVPALAFIPSLQSLNSLWTARISRTSRGVRVHLGAGSKALTGSLAAPSSSMDNWETHKNAVLAEAFRGLRTSVILSKGERPAGSILVTSAQSGEGKTTIAINLAISLAQLGRRVLLIDTDMRRPSVQQHFPQADSRLSSFLEGTGTWQEMTYPSATKGLYVLLCGPVPTNPSELLSSERMRTLMREASLEFNFVIFDSPPLLDVADGRILASMVDATVLVVKGARTHRHLVQYAKAQVQSAGTNLLGIVLNNLDVRLDDYPPYSKARREAMYVRG
jgi:polysaccharide biosynthesis transport protein